MFSSNLLESASLALAAMAVVFGLWSSAISAAQALPKRKQLDDREPEIAEIRETLHKKAAPLVIVSVALFLVLTPPAISIGLESVEHVIDAKGSSLDDYKPEWALFELVWLMIMGLAYVTWRTARDLNGKLKSFVEA